MVDIYYAEVTLVLGRLMYRHHGVYTSNGLVFHYVEKKQQLNF